MNTPRRSSIPRRSHLASDSAFVSLSAPARCQAGCTLQLFRPKLLFPNTQDVETSHVQPLLAMHVLVLPPQITVTSQQTQFSHIRGGHIATTAHFEPRGASGTPNKPRLRPVSISPGTHLDCKDKPVTKSIRVIMRTCGVGESHIALHATSLAASLRVRLAPSRCDYGSDDTRARPFLPSTCMLRRRHLRRETRSKDVSRTPHAYNCSPDVLRRLQERLGSDVCVLGQASVTTSNLVFNSLLNQAPW